MVKNRCLPAPSTAFLEIEDSKAGSFRERMAPTPISPTLCPGVPFVEGHFTGEPRFWLRRHLAVARGEDLSMRCWWRECAAAGRPPNVIYGTTGPRDCCTIVLSRHVQFIANNKIYHALLSSGFLFSCCCCCWETAAAAK